MRPNLEVVVGGQFGSEAKGHVVQRLTERALRNTRGQIHVVRVAGPNAGHTGYDVEGRPWALRQIPVAAVVGSARVATHVAAGSEIDPEVLFDEYDRLTEAHLEPFLSVSAAATILEVDHKNMEGNAGLTAKIGSTGKGIGAARSGRIWRSARTVAEDEKFVAQCIKRGIFVMPHEVTAANFAKPGDHVIIEGTQGYGLGLHTRYYPQVTSSDCRACDFMAMAGVHAWEFEDVNVWVVARVFPIRVAGNSGPLKDETTWEALGLPAEHTTVTKKVRRVGAEDWDLVRQAVRSNGGRVRLALTMLDQKFPHMRDKHIDWHPDQELGNREVADYLNDIEHQTQARIRLITTGPDTASFIG